MISSGPEILQISPGFGCFNLKRVRNGGLTLCCVDSKAGD